MSGVGTIVCFAIAFYQPGTIPALSKVASADPQAVEANGQAQAQVAAQANEVAKALEESQKKLEGSWKEAGKAAGQAYNKFKELRTNYQAMLNQTQELGKRVESAGKTLRSVIQFLDFVKAANAAVMAAMSNPFSQWLAKVLASTTYMKIVAFLGKLASVLSAIGQGISAIEALTKATEQKTAEAEKALTPTAPAPPVAAPVTPGAPAAPGTPVGGQPIYQPQPYPYPSYGSYPPVPPQQPMPQPMPQPAPAPAPAGQAGNGNGIPNVYNSGWIPRSPGGTGGSGERITISLEDPDGDGKYNVKVDAEGDLDKDLKIGGKIGDQEFNVNIDSDTA
jgi:hypothetical protein